MNTNNTQSGISDKARNVDWLGMEGYYTGITKFIELCDTPMTIAIQGDWGIGKTSAMENIQHMLKSKMKNPCIWFKTWQFSAVRNDGNILVEFMLSLLDKLEEQMQEICIADYLSAMSGRSLDKKKSKEQLRNINRLIDREPWNTDEILKLIKDLWTNTNEKKDETNKDITELVNKFSNKYFIKVNEKSDMWEEKKDSHENLLKRIEVNKESLFKFGISFSAAALSAVAGFLPGSVSIAANAAIDYGKDKGLEALGRKTQIEENCSQNNSYKSQTLFLIDISREINRVVEAILNHYDKTGNNKLCIFVDDLDRLQPSIALELLEGLKNFVEYERCVFILAVEKEVIYQGLRSKYDEDFLFKKNENDQNRTRAEKYFDKIIQIPFEIPQKRYDLEEYMDNLLKAKGLSKDEETDSDKPSVADYADVLKKLNIYNPRCIKRCYNLQTLYDSFSETIPNLKEDSSVEKHKDWYDLCSFAVTVIQLEKPNVYNMMMELLDSEIVVSDEKADSTSSSIDVFWNAVHSLENKYIEIVISCFDKAKEKTGLEIRHWLPRILALTNYDDTFNKRRIYIKKLNKIVGMLDADSGNGFDFIEFKKCFDKMLETNNIDFEAPITVANESLKFKIGWGSLGRPYIIIKSKLVENIKLKLNKLTSFKPHKTGNDLFSDNNVYYIYSADEPDEITLYVSGEPDISDDLKELFIELGLLTSSKE